jgi:hypothetical protein
MNRSIFRILIEFTDISFSAPFDIPAGAKLLMCGSVSGSLRPLMGGVLQEPGWENPCIPRVIAHGQGQYGPGRYEKLLGTVRKAQA